MAKNTSSKIFIEALFVGEPNWKPSTCLSISSLPILSPLYVCLCSCLHTPEYLLKINMKWTSMFSLGIYNDIRFKIPTFFFFFFYFVCYIGDQQINKVMIFSGAQQSDSGICIHVSILHGTPIPSRLPQNIEKSSLSLLF